VGLRYVEMSRACAESRTVVTNAVYLVQLKPLARSRFKMMHVMKNTAQISMHSSATTSMMQRAVAEGNRQAVRRAADEAVLLAFPLTTQVSLRCFT
jgi:hypothetical protein